MLNYPTSGGCYQVRQQKFKERGLDPWMLMKHLRCAIMFLRFKYHCIFFSGQQMHEGKHLINYKTLIWCCRCKSENQLHTAVGSHENHHSDINKANYYLNFSAAGQTIRTIQCTVNWIIIHKCPRSPILGWLHQDNGVSPSLQRAINQIHTSTCVKCHGYQCITVVLLPECKVSDFMDAKEITGMPMPTSLKQGS